MWEDGILNLGGVLVLILMRVVILFGDVGGVAVGVMVVVTVGMMVVVAVGMMFFSYFFC